MTAGGTRRRSFKRILQTIHLWVGIILCLPIVVIGITGSLLLIQREMQGYLQSPAATAIGKQESIAHIIEAARAAAPSNTTLGRVDIPGRAGTPAAVQFQTTDRPQRNLVLYVDPVSLDVLSMPIPTARGPFATSVQRLHEFLWLPPIIGLRMVGWVGVAMTFIGISGIILWWPKSGMWRRALLMRRGVRGLALHLDLHHVAGIWGSAVLLIMSISGMYLTFPETVSSAFRMLPSGVGEGGTQPGFVQSQGPLDADGAIASANAAVAHAHAIGIQMPEREGRPIVVYMASTGLGPTIPPILVAINQQSGQVTYVDDPRTYAGRDQVLNWLYALHFGLGFGWLWNVLVFLSGVLPLLLAVTGLNIWWLKRRVSRRLPEGATAPAE